MSTGGTIEEAVTQLVQSASALEAPAAGERDVVSLPDALGALAHALRVASQACDDATTSVVPAASLDTSVCNRYGRAAASWPVAPAPSYEQLAMLQTLLQEAAGAAHRAAERCDRAKDAIDAALGRTTHTRGEP
jgi:hypothetical protein